MRRAHLLLLLPLTACALATKPRPAAHGVLELEAGLGGPVAQFGGVTFPLPIPSLGARHGLTPRFDVQGHVHLAPLRWGGIGADLGTTGLVLREDGYLPAVALTGRAFLFTEFQYTYRPLAEVAAHASWRHGERFMTFVGASLFLDPSERARLVVLSAGESIRLGRFTLSLELRAYEPSIVHRAAALRIPQFLGYAPFGGVLGVTYAFGEGAN